MQTSTTAANIIDRTDYKLDITLTEFRQNEFVLSIRRWIPELKWSEQTFFLTPEELGRIQDQLNNVTRQG